MGRLKFIEKALVDNSPAIFSGLAVTGVVTTGVLAGVASYKAALIIAEEEQFGLEELDGRELFKQRFKAVGSLYIPAATSATVTIGAVVLANRIGHRRAGAVAAAYALSEKAFEQYREATVRKVGANQERDIRDEVQRCIIEADPLSNKQVILTGSSEVLCYESFTGRYFESSVETLKKAQNDTNYRLLNDGYVSLSDFYDFVGLPHTATSDNVGWKYESKVELEFTTVMSEDQRPCIAVNYHVQPIRDFYKSW